MADEKWLIERFEADRDRLRAVAYRMTGSLGEAEDAVQQAWLRLSRADVSEVENLAGWLTTVVARVCLDMLRARRSRREEPLDSRGPEPAADARAANPEQELALADSVGLALLVVLERLAPAERLAFVLHDLFDLPFEEIAPLVGRSPTAARQLASRARRRVRGGTPAADPDTATRRRVIEAFLAASRDGDFGALLAVLDPEVVFRADPTAMQGGAAREVRGAAAVAGVFLGRAQAARAALVDGAVEVLVAPLGHLLLVLGVTIADGRITGIDAIADPERLRRMELTVLGG